MATLVYSPGIHVVIDTIQHGVIDVSRDITKGDLTIEENVPATLHLSLRNAKRKYDGVFTPNDRISVRMRRIKWVPVFTGYLNTVPMWTTYPRNVDLSATCSLKRLRYFLLDPGTAAMQDLLGDVGQSVDRANEGIKAKMLNVLTEVVKWDANKIHLSEIPQDWIRAMSAAWDIVSEELEVPDFILGGSAATVGGGSVAGMGPTTIDGIGPGTGSLPDTRGTASWFGGPNGGAYGNMALSGESGTNPRDPWYAAMRWPYVSPDLQPNGAVAGAKEWWNGRKILVRATGSGKMVCLRAADWGPNVRLVPRIVDMSQEALEGALAAGTDAEVQVSFAPTGTRLGPVHERLVVPPSGGGGGGGGSPGDGTHGGNRDRSNGPETQPRNVRGAKASRSGQGAPQGRSLPDGGSGGNPGGVYGDDHHDPSAVAAANPRLKVFPVGAGYSPISDSFGAPRSGGRSHLGCDIMAPVGTPLYAIWDGVILNPNSGVPPAPADDGTGSFTANSFHLKCDDGHTWFYTHNNRNSPHLREGLRVRAGEVLGEVGHTGNAASDGPHLHISLSVGNPQPDRAEDSSTAVNPFPVLQSIEQTGTTGSGGVSGSGAYGAQGGLQAIVAGMDWIGVISPESETLVGERAIMNDTPALDLISTLMKASLRSFCAAPNGDLIGWFPDYFDHHGALAKMMIEDIETGDFTMTWDDQFMITHQYVVGTAYSDPRNPGGPGGPVEAYQKAITKGVVTVEHPEIIQALLNLDSGSLLVDMTDKKEIYKRFGARKDLVAMTSLRAEADFAEFWMACYNFMANWAKMFVTQVSMTFMPELYPGMLAVFPSVGIQAYVKSVTHSWDFSSAGFDTTAVLIAPSGLSGTGIAGLPRAGALSTPSSGET